jgi:hypothetical protein
LKTKLKDKLTSKTQKKSVGELAIKNILDNKYKGLSTLLEPHEVPKIK